MFQGNTMIVGIDVYHDKSQKKRSIAGFVASTNPMCTRWYSRVCIQPVNQELIDGLKLCMVSAITKYHEVCRRFVIILLMIKVMKCFHSYK